MNTARNSTAVTAGISSAGAYGLTWTGLTPDDRDLVSPVPDGWTPWSVTYVEDAGRARGDWYDELTDDDAVLAVAGGTARLDRRTASTVLALPTPPSPAELTHPFLGATAAVAAHWRGELSFHCAAFEAGGRVWAVVGDREAGKSTTVAALWRAGAAIVCDDLLIVRGRTALAGPRSLDLRRPTAEWLGAGVELGVVGLRERWRIQLAPVPAELDFGGFIVLDWGPETRLELVPTRARPAVVMSSLAVLSAPRDPVQLLELFSLPIWRFVRPQHLDALGVGAELLLTSLS